jgi:hypothetical protein
VLSLEFPPGKPLGNPGDTKMQKQIIEAGFDLLSKEISDMKIVDLPFKLKKFGLF